MERPQESVVKGATAEASSGITPLLLANLVAFITNVDS
jgi:hypothetical protein